MAARPAAATGPTGRTVTLALTTLALTTFVIGTAELVIVGLLDQIAADTHVSIGTAGHLVTAYALGIAFGAPAITASTGRFGPRAVLWLALLAFLAGNLLAVAAVDFDMLLVARVVTGSLHGLIAGLATSMAAVLVPPARRGQAISLVVGGITVSTVVGVPAGTVIGHALGWRTAFVVVSVLAAAAFAATLRFVPEVTGSAQGGTGAQLRAALAPRVVAVLGVGFVIYAGQFTAFTYLAPFLTEATGVSSGMVSVFLLVFGLAALAGTLGGGRAADRSAPATLVIANVVLAAALAVMYGTGATAPLAMIAVAVWGLAGFAIAPVLLVRGLDVATGGSGLVPTLVISAVNAGIAAGSVIGGVVVGHGAAATMLTAALIAAAAIPATWASGRIRAATPVTPGPTAVGDAAVANASAPLAAACMCRQPAAARRS